MSSLFEKMTFLCSILVADIAIQDALQKVTDTLQFVSDTVLKIDTNVTTHTQQSSAAAAAAPKPSAPKVKIQTVKSIQLQSRSAVFVFPSSAAVLK